MGRRILNKCYHYGLHIFAPLALLLIIIAPHFADFLISFNTLRLPNEIFEYPAYLLLIVLWGFPFLLYMVSTIYKDKTGRNYIYDHRKYKRSFSDLMEYFHDADPHLLDSSQFEFESWKEAKGIILGETEDGRLIKISSDTECNIFVAGTTGSSKTTALAIPNCRQFGGSIFAIDIKGDIFNACHPFRKILRFCPDLTDKNGKNIALENSCSFNPFAGINKMSETEKKMYLTNMAMMLIPDEGGSDGNYFSSRSRKLFIGITLFLMSLKPNITFPEILHAILHNQQPEGIDMEKFPKTVFDWVITISDSDYNAAKEQVKSLIGNNEKNISGAFDNLTTALIPFSNDILDVLLSGKGRCISPKELEKGNDIYLQISQNNLKVYAPLFTMIISSFMEAFAKRPDSSTGTKNRPILFVLDEFPQLTFSYGQMDKTLATLRSKNVKSMIIAQNCSQLEHRYTRVGCDALLGNCNYQLILKSNDSYTQKHFYDKFGTRKVLKISNSDTKTSKKNKSITIQETREPIYQPEDFGDLGRKMVIYFDGKRIEAIKIKSWE